MYYHSNDVPIMAIRLTIPKQLPDRRFSIGSSAAELNAWFAGLPLGQDDQLAMSLLPVLIESNRIDLDITLRHAFLASFRSVVDPLIESLRQKVREAAQIALDQKSTRRLVMLRRFLQEMSYAYKLMVVESLRPNHDTHTKATAIYGAVHYLGKSLLEHYDNYEPVAGNTWGELNLLYRLAIREKIEKHIIAFDASGKSTIDLAYKQLALLAAVNPYRLMRGEAVQVYRFMAVWCSHCELMTRESGWSPKGEVVVNLASDDPPTHVRPGSKILDVSTLRVLDIAKVQSSIRHTLDELAKDSTKSSEYRLATQLQHDILKRLNEGWQGEVSRSDARVSHQADMELIDGLANACAAYRIAAQNSSLDAYSFSGLSLVPLNEHQGTRMAPGIGNPFKIDDPNFGVWNDTAVRVGSEDIDKENGPPVYSITRVDVSEGGYGMQISGEAAARIRVGDIVLVRLRGAGNSPWAVGDVRWKRIENDQQLSFGVRLLAAVAQPIELTVIEGRGLGSRPAGGLLIPAEGFDHPESSLLLPATVYGEGTQLKLWSTDDKLVVKLTQLMDTTNGFARFHYTILKRLKH